MAPAADRHPLSDLRAIDRRAFLLRAASAGVAVPLLSTLTMAQASAASEIKFVAMDYDALT